MNNLKVLFSASMMVVFLLITGCASINPVSQLDALKKYNYEVTSVTELQLANADIQDISKFNNSSISALPSIVMGIMRKDLAFQGTANLKISNSTGQAGAINAFRYIIEINGKPFFEGMVDQRIQLPDGGSSVVPISFKSNLFGITDDRNGIQKVLGDIFSRKGNGLVVLKIQPSINVGGQNIFYPGYLTVDNDLLKSLSGLIK